jgi:Uma2 family endonuclease
MMFIHPQLAARLQADGPPQGRWTFADWEVIPDHTDRYEVIDGNLYVSPTPSTFHQWILRQLYEAISFSAEAKGAGYSGFARVSVIMSGCQPVQPDYLFVGKDRNVRLKRYVWGVPDLIVEVLSPETIAYDEQIKFRVYATAGVPEYAIIDPAERTLRLYTLDAPGRYAGPREFDSSQTMSFACLPGIALEVSRLFEGAPDTTL